MKYLNKKYKKETCFNYIIDEIKYNYLSLIKKNEHINYKMFISSYPLLIKSLCDNKKTMITNFNLGLSFDELKFNEYNFKDFYY